MEDFNENYSSYDENDIEDFEEYLNYYGFEDDEVTDSCDEDNDVIESDNKELYF